MRQPQALLKGNRLAKKTWKQQKYTNIDDVKAHLSWNLFHYATDPKTTTTELKPAIFQFILPLKSADVLVDGAGAGRS